MWRRSENLADALTHYLGAGELDRLLSKVEFELWGCEESDRIRDRRNAVEVRQKREVYGMGCWRF